MAKSKKEIVPENKPLSFNPMDIYAAPRMPGDSDLVELVALNLNSYADKRHVAAFVNSVEIQSVAAANSIVQRIAVNRYFINRLLIYRSVSGKSVIDILPYIVNDGYVEDWMKLMKELILPFTVKHEVLLATV